uniref:Glyoxalase family protein n=1 Tax=Sphingomonas sp. JE1 TaxID=1628059 RepID=A0A0D4ZZA0_9SPHN|nr:Glyoxalase family protein [Sphingomonas sp. JE1]
MAFRCRDTAETMHFYTEVLGLKFSHAVANDYVGSTGEFSPHLHTFFELDDSSSIAFFEVPLSPPKQKDPNTPAWVEHVAFRMRSYDEFKAFQKRLDDNKIEYLGPLEHYSQQYSIYFFDPNGIRLEFNVAAPIDPEKRAANARRVLAQWEERRAKGFSQEKADA